MRRLTHRPASFRATPPSALPDVGPRPPLDRLATQHVREMITCRRDVHVADLAVEVREGRAMLHGAVASDADADTAARIALAVIGVGAVRSHLYVCPTLAARSRPN